MAQRYDVLASAGAVLPTTNGVYYTAEMSAEYAFCNVYVEFFSDADGTVPATATAGTITVYGSPMGNTYLLPSNITVINATEVSAGTYTPASMDGCMVRGKVVLAGITGAAYCRIIFWRS